MKQKIALVGMEWDVIDLIESMARYEITGFFAPSPPDAAPFCHLGDDASWPAVKRRTPELQVALALDSPALRKSLYEHYGEESLATLLSPCAYISPRARLGPGAIVQRGATLLANVTLGRACKVNVGASLHHDAKIGSFCTLAPGAQILGRVELKEGVYVGAGAIIKQRCSIGAGTVIGAGAVVISDLPGGITAVGVPARAVSRISEASPPRI